MNSQGSSESLATTLARDLGAKIGEMAEKKISSKDPARWIERLEGQELRGVPEEGHVRCVLRRVRCARERVGRRHAPEGRRAIRFGQPALRDGTREVVADPAPPRIGAREIAEGDWMSIDGTLGEVYAGKLGTVVPDISDPLLSQLLGWADGMRRLEVWANADYPRDARKARELGAEIEWPKQYLRAKR